MYLAKVCRKLQVPLPGPAHWTKIACDHKIPRPPLPEVENLSPDDFSTEPIDEGFYRRSGASDSNSSGGHGRSRRVCFSPWNLSFASRQRRIIAS